ncbi:single-stranded DNA-binding protein [Patescibacteria group bacterium]|nr:single-stranded DNA-binding protein [Patescibacteria group bacterium]
MAKDLNKVMIIGNLTRDPELKTTPSGQQVVALGVATNRSWKGADGQAQEAVEFHNVEAWGKLAEIIAQYLTKGGRAYFEGRLQTDQWEAKDGGGKRSRTKLVVQDMILLGGRGGGAGGGAADQSQSQPSEAEASQEPASESKADAKKADKAEDASLDDIPF